MLRIIRIALLAALTWSLLAFITGTAQEKAPAQEAKPATPTKVPPEAAQRKNPIPASDDSIALGKRLFASQCAMCHGDTGDGKGELAEEMKLAMPDLTDAEKMKGRTDGELFYLISEGHEPMPGQGKRMTEAQRWHFVNFMRALSKPAPKDKPPAKAPAAKQ